MGQIIKLYNTWEKAKQVFVKPSLKVYFGKWSKDPNLPVWRRGALVYICSRKKLSSYCHTVNNSVMIKTGVRSYLHNNKEHFLDCYEWVPKHALPSGLRCGDYVWNHNIRKKLRKWHLDWLPPIIELPIWTRFHIINFDLGWKTKYDSVRYEFPPQFTIVAFGLSLSLTLHSPKSDKYGCDDHYWEAILNHIYKNKSGSLKETIELSGIWTTYKEDTKTSYFAVRPDYITAPYKEEYYAAVSDIKCQQERAIL